jgi:anti-sigma factor RsiW
MNCEKIQNRILLNQTGELPEQEIEILHNHLAECEKCRRYLEDIERIISTARTSLPAGEPDATVMAGIIAAAKEEATRKTLLFSLPSVRWAACAAAAVFLVCGAALWSFSEKPASTASQMSTIVMAVGSEEVLHAISQSGKAEKDQELQSLASHLLLMEGFIVDEHSVETDFNDAVDESQPTALQQHSIDVFEWQRCV